MFTFFDYNQKGSWYFMYFSRKERQGWALSKIKMYLETEDFS